MGQADREIWGGSSVPLMCLLVAATGSEDSPQYVAWRRLNGAEATSMFEESNHHHPELDVLAQLWYNLSQDRFLLKPLKASVLPPQGGPPLSRLGRSA